MTKIWVLLPQEGEISAEMILRQRGIPDIEGFLDPDYYHPALPENLPDLEQASSRLNQALESGELALIWGDFDVDGLTATVLLVEALTHQGGRVNFHVPAQHGIDLPT